MAKILFTPFSENDAAGGTRLGGRLLQVTDGQGKVHGIGNSRSERIFSPTRKTDDSYNTTSFLKNFGLIQNTDDELYINAHGATGYQLLANLTNVGDPKALKVSMEDLVKQLEAHQLPKDTYAKIKLWVCESALGFGLSGGPNRPFAEGFSKKMWDEQYHNCYIYGYAGQTIAFFKQDFHKAAKYGPDENVIEGWASRFRRRYQNGIEIPEAPDLGRAQERGKTLTKKDYWLGPKSPELLQKIRG
jgi:hypothetical protein